VSSMADLATASQLGSFGRGESRGVQPVFALTTMMR
jgi:hypothetical protein